MTGGEPSFFHFSILSFIVLFRNSSFFSICVSAERPSREGLCGCPQDDEKAAYYYHVVGRGAVQLEPRLKALGFSAGGARCYTLINYFQTLLSISTCASITWRQRTASPKVCRGLVASSSKGSGQGALLGHYTSHSSLFFLSA